MGTVAADEGPVPLRRNRNFLFFQVGQLLSDTGTQSASIAYPLLVLLLTDSPAKAGLVSFARAAPLAALALPAGLLADHLSRRLLMVTTDAIRAAAVGALAVLVLTHDAPFWLLPVLAAVDGAATTVFNAAEVGALRAVVPIRQLPEAITTSTGRQAAVLIGGPPLGGVLFAVAASLPFLVDSASYAFSSGSLLAMRTPFEQPREPDPATIRQRLVEGIRFLWSRPFMRLSALLIGGANFVISGLVLAVVVLADRHGLSGGEVGLLVASFGVSLMIGSTLSPLVRRHLSIRGVMLSEMWTYPSCVLFLIWPNVYVLAACLVPTGLAIASNDSVVHGYRIGLTPDRLLGRVESVRTTVSQAMSPLGPLAVGVLLSTTSARATIAVFAAVGIALALWATMSPALRGLPPLEEVLSGESGVADIREIASQPTASFEG
jgi:MFS family permease